MSFLAKPPSSSPIHSWHYFSESSLLPNFTKQIWSTHWRSYGSISKYLRWLDSQVVTIQANINSILLHSRTCSWVCFFIFRVMPSSPTDLTHLNMYIHIFISLALLYTYTAVYMIYRRYIQIFSTPTPPISWFICQVSLLDLLGASSASRDMNWRALDSNHLQHFPRLFMNSAFPPGDQNKQIMT